MSSEMATELGFSPSDCLCHACQKERIDAGKQMQGSFGLPNWIHLSQACACGNKRCPRASDHRLECTGSNEPGQAGSIYA